MKTKIDIISGFLGAVNSIRKLNAKANVVTMP